MVDFDSPDRWAIDARDQWVAFLGVFSSVATFVFFFSWVMVSELR
jgi:hypothetical protein